MTSELEKFEKKLGLSFKDKALFTRAFTHRSYLNEHKKQGLENNERLEFLGDAVLELVITHFLYLKFPDRAEGDLTSYRAALVNTINLGRIATELGINEYLLLSKGEAKDIGRARSIILADTIEALIGAIYLDLGYDEASKFITKYVLGMSDIDLIVKNKLWLDAKSRFQERAQEESGITPSYKLVRETGPDHDKQFTIGVFIGKSQVATGTGPSKQEAEQAAAEKGLEAKGW
ncbi:MAG: ribonuclease III [Candidatus Taylorbacteria bacterium]|nr:ribonuclease III [Candidatus Taylorbacteria bacterium]